MPPEESFASPDVGSPYRNVLLVLIIAEKGVRASTFLLQPAIHRRMSAGYAKEVREATEGRVPAAVSLEGKIDYAAGQSAKAQLMKKLGASEG